MNTNNIGKIVDTSNRIFEKYGLKPLQTSQESLSPTNIRRSPSKEELYPPEKIAQENQGLQQRIKEVKGSGYGQQSQDGSQIKDNFGNKLEPIKWDKPLKLQNKAKEPNGNIGHGV